MKFKEQLSPVCWVFTPLVEQLDVRFLDISDACGFVDDGLVVGECDEIHLGLAEGFGSHIESIGVCSHHTDDLASVHPDCFHGLEAAASGGDKVLAFKFFCGFYEIMCYL